MKEKFDIYQMVTDRIISQLENGVIPWRKPWTGAGPAYNRVSGKYYSLANQILLPDRGEWATFKQWQEAGGHVKKGEKSSICIFWKMYEKKNKDSGDDEKPEYLPVLRYYNVFHISQVEGVEAKKDDGQPYRIEGIELLHDSGADAIITDYVNRSGIKLIEKLGSRAFYRPTTDSVTVPEKAQFENQNEWYSTVFHELTHSTGHPDRLNRLENAKFGSPAYSKEELTAEIGAAALMNLCELEQPQTFENTAAYIDSWLTVLRNDKKAIISAASRAEKAMNFILGRAETEVQA